MSDVLLDVRNLKKYFSTPDGMLHAVDDVSFSIERGKTLGVVGESGCGKSTTGRAILRLVEPTAGKIIFDGVDVATFSAKEMRAKRKEMQDVVAIRNAGARGKQLTTKAIARVSGAKGSWWDEREPESKGILD